jgi:transcriptional regulator with XRE-family HTH domain
MGNATNPRPYIAPADPQHAGTAVWTWRIAHDLTTRELAKLLGVASGAVSMWENGKRRVPGWVPMALLGVDLTLMSRKACQGFPNIGYLVQAREYSNRQLDTLNEALEDVARLRETNPEEWVDLTVCFSPRQ